MNLAEIKTEVDNIIEIGDGDPEVAHSYEDRLLLKLLMEYAPADVISELVRLQKADFPRWCA